MSQMPMQNEFANALNRSFDDFTWAW